MDEYLRQHDPDQIVPAETGPGDIAPHVHYAPEAPGREIERPRPLAPTRPASPPPRQGFWGSLTRAEQDDLLAYADEVVYPVGTVLWFEGQTADHAVVIQSGSVRVSVNRHGHERIIAFRRPGDIVGERAALLLRRRSATIVAMDTVRGLRMTTQQFATYLSDHPRVVAVMESELYDRLTEPAALVPQTPPQYDPTGQYWPPPAPLDPATAHGSPYSGHTHYSGHTPYLGHTHYSGHTYATAPAPLPHPPADHLPLGTAASVMQWPGDGSWPAHPVPTARVPSEDEPTQPMAVDPPAPTGPAWAGRNCTIVYTDIAGFSASHRNDRDRLDMRRAMYTLLREAFAESAVPWHSCHIEDRGDGALIVVPPEIPTAAVIDPMIASLATRLRRHNQRSTLAVRIQLRIAVHVGPVLPDPPGVSGWAVIRTARLLDARPLKERLAATGADLGFITSGFVYESVIAHSPGCVNPAEYEPISCRVKKLKLEGWIHLRGVPAQSAV